MSDQNFDCVVVGAGPGGYVAAIRASQLGLKTAIVEKEAPGGVCLNWGCIPTKALLKSAEVFEQLKHAGDYGISLENPNVDFPAVIKRSRQVVARMTKGVQFLLKKNNVELIIGQASFTSATTLSVAKDDGSKISPSFRKAIIATGASARVFPQWSVDQERIITYRKALALPELPKKLLVVGAGAIGVELAYFFSTLGTEVTIVELLPQILPVEDEEVAKTLEKSFLKRGIKLKLGATVEELARQGEAVRARIKESDSFTDWEGDYALIAVGMRGNIEDLGLETLGIQTEKSFIRVNNNYQTSQANIYAIGDVVGPPLLAHVASHEGIIAAEHLAGHLSGQAPHALDYSQIPGCTYCSPQVASIGLTEKAAKEKGLAYKVGRFPFSASGKAVALGETEGFVKVIIDERYEEVLGVHIIHPEATELIGEAAVILSHEGIASSVFNTIHAHPTLSEALMEAMGDALGRAIHI